MGLAPNHKVDHVPKLVLSFDSCWDADRLNKEIEAQGKTKHPWLRYHRGETRGDLEAVRHYMKLDRTPDQEPVVFSFRRMSLPQWALYTDREAGVPGAPGQTKARIFAIRCCLLDDGAPLKFSRSGTEGGYLSDEDLDRLREFVSDEGMMQIGRMAAACSEELLDDEKKP